MAVQRMVLYGVRKTADLLGITPKVLFEEVDNGKIVAHRRGDYLRFKPDDIAAYEKLQIVDKSKTV